jgi:hypothetical protein
MVWPERMHARVTAPPARGAGRRHTHLEPLPAQTVVPRATSTGADARFTSPVT